MEQISISVLAVAIAVFAAPLFVDLAICIAGNFFRARQPSRLSREAACPEIRLAVVVPAHNEEAMIATTIRSLRVAGPGTPVYVVAHNCTDDTAEIAAQGGAHVLVLSNPRLRGKGAALRHGFAAAIALGSNAILVVDADTLVSANLIEATRLKLSQGAEATQCRYELHLAPDQQRSPMARLRALAFRGMNVLRAKGRAGLGFSTGIFGNGFALTASALERVPFEADSIAEDVEYHTRLVSAGIPVFWIGNAFVRAQPPNSREAQASQEARWEGGRVRVARQSTPRLLAAILHGRWRAIETLADVWSLPLSRGIIALLLTAGLPVHWLHVFAIACALITLFYVVEAAMLGAEPVDDLIALAGAPLYLLWKALITPLVLRQSRSRAEWARTKREAPQQ
jgi:cellulose synthase/poly-beta-1,6-N-acetylglucosamine synthase-like glycosyltransferase